MNVCSLEWVICLVVFSALFFMAPGVRLRQALLAACNFGFVATLIPNNAGWIALAIFVGCGYLAASVLRRFPNRNILILYLLLLLSAFIVLKQYAFIKLLLPTVFFQKVIATVGWSYMLFRQIQVAVDACQGQIEHLCIWNYINFQFNLFGFVAGPIQHYQEFCRYWMNLSPIIGDAESILRAYLRVFVGVLKITVLAGTSLTLFNTWADLLGNAVLTGQQAYGWRMLQLLGLFYAYPLYIYFNFSGYCDMVIAGASLFGLKMPENFDRPYLSRNMIDYWTRFHQTLGFWIRDYVFTPMYKAIASRWPAKAASLAFLCYLVAFFLVGLWHGSTWNFVIFGILNGVGVAAAKLWEYCLVKRIGRQGLRRYLQSRPIRTLAIAGTLHYVCFTLLFFPSDMGRTVQIIKHAVQWDQQS
jgi:D-alanyl-lipoteichoic acid acyltransferase DltB (MBOAT superfamily)